jgi:hypothetical protein
VNKTYVVDIDNSQTKKIVPTKAYLDEIIFIGTCGFTRNLLLIK